jgi:predicted phage terminase large subunit-like protein
MTDVFQEDEQLRRELYRAELERRRARDEAEALSGDLRAFGRAAWKVLKPVEAYKDNWHIDAICEHLTAVSNGQLTRLQIWVPRATMKSLNVSVFWHPWEWTTKPWLRYWTAVYELGLAGRIAGMSRNLILSEWYQQRWGDKFRLVKDGEKYLSNNQGGTRLATAPGSTALGEHGHRIIIDDPINALAADATSRVMLDSTNEWYDATVEGSKADPKRTAIVIIMQRLHENDLAAHAYDKEPDDWTILCLPERYEHDHPHVWHLDPRLEDGELLWPDRRGDKESDKLAKALGYRAAGQMQQRPSAREGDLLKRYWWRFYDPRLFTDDRMKRRRPRFSMVVQSVDTPLKDKESNDLVAIQAWGVHGGDRYLLDLKKGHMSKHQAKRAIKEQSEYVKRVARGASRFVLIENAGYGVELIEELKREMTGVKGLSRAHEGDKVLRAEAASAALETGNCFLPGYREGVDELSMPDDDRNAAEITDFIDNCANFPNARYDDDVDAWSQAMNWLSARPTSRSRVFSSFKVHA